MLTHPPDTGDTRADLALLLADIVAIGEAIGLSITGVVLPEETEHAELLDHWRRTVGAADLRAVNEIVEHGRRRGQVRSDLDASIVADLILGAYLGHYTHQGPPDHNWIDGLIEILWPGLVARTT